MRKKKVLHVSCGGLGNGGVQSVIMNISRNLINENFEFDILVFTSERRYYDNEFEKLGGRIFRIPCNERKNSILKKLDYYIRFFRIFFGIIKILRENGPYDVIHCHNYFEAGICCIAAKMCGVRIRISHSHSDMRFSQKNNFFAKIYNMFLREVNSKFSNFKIGCSTNACKYLYKKSDKYFVIENGIDLDKFNLNLKIDNKEKKYITISHVGQYSKIKNQEYILEIIYHLCKKEFNCRLNLIGFGEYKSKLLNKVKELNLEGNVTFLNHDIDIPNVLCKSDIFIFPSLSEGLGIALLEAQALNLNCFASNTIPKESDLGKCTYLDLNLGSEKWADIISKNLIDNKKIDMNKLNKIDIKNVITKYKEIYNEF